MTKYNSEYGPEQAAKQATPDTELHRVFMDATEPKSEREWWAWRTIQELRIVNAELKRELEGFRKAQRSTAPMRGAE